MRVSIVALIVIMAAGSARADDPSPVDKAEHFTLEELLKVAIRVAPELQSSAFDVATAVANRQAADGIENWAATAGTQNTITKALASTNEAFAASVGLSRLLPTNGNLQFGVNASKNAHVEPRATNKFVTIDFSVAITQPLLANSGVAVEQSTIRQAAHALSSATIRRAAGARTFVASVAEAYWRLALAWRRLDVLHLSLDSAEKELATIQRGLLTGAIAKSEAVPFAQSIASRKIDIVNAEGDIVAQSLALRTLVGLEIPPDAPAVRTIDLPRTKAVPIDAADIVKRALATSDALKAAIEDVRGAEAGMVAADRNLLPTLDISLKGDITSSHNTLVDAIDELPYDRDYAVTFGATFALPVGRDAQKGAYALTRATVARARFGVLSSRKQIAADVMQLASQARTSLRTIELSEQVVSLAEQNVEAERRKFELGKSTSNEVVRRRDELENARLQLENANAEATVALIKIEAATGQILDHYGILMIDAVALTNTELGRK